MCRRGAFWWIHWNKRMVRESLIRPVRSPVGATPTPGRTSGSIYIWLLAIGDPTNLGWCPVRVIPTFRENPGESEQPLGRKICLVRELLVRLRTGPGNYRSGKEPAREITGPVRNRPGKWSFRLKTGVYTSGMNEWRHLSQEGCLHIWWK